VAKEVEETDPRGGRAGVFDLGIHRVHADLVKLIREAEDRTSYGRTLHAFPGGGFLCGMQSPRSSAERQRSPSAPAAPRHREGGRPRGRGPHALIGADLAGNTASREIVHAIGAHHETSRRRTSCPSCPQAAPPCPAPAGGAPRDAGELPQGVLRTSKRSRSRSPAWKSRTRSRRGGRSASSSTTRRSGRCGDPSRPRTSRRRSRRTSPTRGRSRVTVIAETRAIEYAR